MSTDDADTVADGEPLDEDEQRELIRLAKKAGIEEPKDQATEVSRRGVMGALGAAGVAGLAGFSTGKARGQQSQPTGTIGDGNQDAELLDVTAELLSASDVFTDYVYNVREYGAVGDGTTDDTAAIQSAVDAANSAGGGVVYLPDGDYLKTGGVNMDEYANIAVVGDGRFTSKVLQSGDGAGFDFDNASNIEFRHLGVIGDPAAANNSTQTGIRSGTGVTNLTVSSCYIADWAYDGAYALSDSSRVSFVNNIVENCGDDGLNPGGSGPPGTTDILVANNQVFDCGVDNIHISQESDRAIVVGNTSINAGGAGIGSVNGGHTIIANNFVQGSGGSGITDNDTSHTLMKLVGNVVLDAAVDGIASNGGGEFHIGHNSIKNSSKVGIRVQYGSASDAKVRVSGNVVEGAGDQCIYLSTSQDAVVSDNTISAGGGRANIETRTVDGLVVNGNMSYDHPDRGIYAVGVNHAVVSDNVMRDDGGLDTYSNGTDVTLTDNIEWTST